MHSFIFLLDALQEALFVTGDFSRLSSIIEQPLVFARSFEDKLNIYNNLVRSLGSSGKTEEAITTAIAVLAQLGEVVPTNITADIYSDEVTNIKRLLHDKSRHDLLSLPIMVDVHKLAAMQFLNHALSLAYVAKPAVSPIILFRMIKLSIEHGGRTENAFTCLACDVSSAHFIPSLFSVFTVCNISVFAFGCYGAWLVSALNSDFEGGYSMGRVATELMRRLNAIEVWWPTKWFDLCLSSCLSTRTHLFSFFL